MSSQQKDDLLDDLEDFVSDDWTKVHAEFKREEHRKEISKPVIPDFPNFDEFYALMVDLQQEQYLTPGIAELVHRFLRNQGRDAPNGFRKIWSFFTDPHRYGTIEQHCTNCNKEYVVIFEREPIPRVNIDQWNQESTMEMISETVLCPHCGSRILHVTGKVVGIIDNRRRDEIKHESRANF